ncbi:FtsX-like permease family protein [Arthrobacter sp. CAN_C5]|uniref:ABC transporter permease n=1 Tax=Arthrobacter sp. CAN_C5 TaxID=2760706 RepID=UPI001AE99F9A|nr:FtsX-like permease family protein [Arthrobacter sp. CAN_C5]MBP2216236.1 putative ABC transport system permease protein [Arthrobacter sp. CAN_C5]
MLQVALAQVRAYGRRFIAVGLAVMLGVGFLSATLMVSGTTQASLQQSLGATYAKADLVVSLGEGAGSAVETEQLLSGIDGVSAVHAAQRTISTLSLPTGPADVFVLSTAPDELQSSTLADGRLPVDGTGITIDKTAASQLGLGVGDSFALEQTQYSPDGEPLPPKSLTVTLTGITENSADPYLAGLPQVYAAPDLVESLSIFSPGEAPPQATTAQLALDGSATVADVRTATASALSASGVSAEVRTSAEQVTADVAALSGGTDQLTVILLAFAVVAILVTVLVIANTFSVLVAQRTRDLALLRCIGASRAQIRRSVLIEAGIVGLVSSVLGVLLAAGVMWALVSLAAAQDGTEFATLAIPPSSVLAGLIVGVVMTLVAAFVPARAATAVAPLEALRPAEDATTETRRGKARLFLGLVLVLLGAGLLGVGAASSALLVALPGGVLSFVGVLLCASLFLPALVTAVGKLATPLGVPGRLAAINAVRNPARTTATASALLVGVTLVTMMMAGAQTSRTAFEAELGANYPVDLAVQEVGSAAAADAAVTTVERLDGVDAALALSVGAVSDDATGAMPVYAISPDEAEAVLRSEDPGLVDDVVFMPQDSGLTEVTLMGADGPVTLPVQEVQTQIFVPTITAATAAELGTAPLPGVAALGDGTGILWLKLDDSLDAAGVTGLRSDIVEALGVSEYQVNGAAIERVSFNQIIDVILLVVTALLAVAVLIALIGVANTLSLSVLERTRESSLLRALGLTRAQLRGMLAVEAVLIAGVAAAFGCLLGVVYGWLGVQSALGAIAPVTPSIPWLQLLGVLAVAVIAALLASVLPARRAARLSPVEGLATA